MGEIYEHKMTWENFQLWQSWDEYPELKDDPPLEVDIMFTWRGHNYGIDYMHPWNAERNKMLPGYYLWNLDEPMVVSPPLFRMDRFIDLLNEPLFDGKSFKERIEEFGFNA